MIDVSQDKFTTDFMTTFLATWAAEQFNMRGASARNAHPPVGQAVEMARRAWIELMDYGMVRG